MQITFLGAAGEVTGSCYLVQTSSARVLVDCGLFQGTVGSDMKNHRPFAFDPRSLDAVVVTHAHLDHTGRLPLLTKQGLKCRLYCTRPTVPLSDLLLQDMAELQKADLMRRNRKRADRGCGPGRICEPLFTEQDVARTIHSMTAIPLETEQPIARGVGVRFVDAGHIIGSSSVVLTVEDQGKKKVIVFSGDIGNPGTPILKDPVPPMVPQADAVILESTYGDRDHKTIDTTLEELLGVLRQSMIDGGKVLIPAFAIGRTQTLLYHLARMSNAGQLPRGLPVYIDTPMGIEATRIYESDPTFFDSEMVNLRANGNPPLRFPGLHFTRSGDESRMLNTMKGPAVIIAGAGMCTGGRILHHLKHHAGKANTHIVIAGYQSEGTIGRRLVNREKMIRIYGLPIAVNAQIHTLGGFSAHGGQSTLLAWAQSVTGKMPRKPRFHLTHGETMQRTTLAGKLRETIGVEANLPMYGDRVEL